MDKSTTTLAPVGGVGYACMVDGCDWVLTTERALPGQAIPGAASRHEALIADHLTSHDRVQYVATIDRLRRELQALQAAHS